jgi:hypothetical protein
VASVSWRLEAAAHTPMLLQRLCERARDMAESSLGTISQCSNRGAAVATAAFTSHLARLHHFLLPHLPSSREQEHHTPLQHHARARLYGGRSAGVADDEDVHLAQYSAAGMRDVHAHRRHHLHHQHQHERENSLRLTWMHVWRSCR